MVKQHNYYCIGGPLDGKYLKPNFTPKVCDIWVCGYEKPEEFIGNMPEDYTYYIANNLYKVDGEYVRKILVFVYEGYKGFYEKECHENFDMIYERSCNE